MFPSLLPAAYTSPLSRHRPRLSLRRRQRFATDDAGRVCVTKQGRLISSTSLVINQQARKCDPKRYIDATKFPGIVVPNRESEDRAIDGDTDPEVAPPFAERGVRRGDLAVVYNPETKIWKGAFLYDTGPRRLLG